MNNMLSIMLVESFTPLECTVEVTRWRSACLPAFR